MGMEAELLSAVIAVLYDAAINPSLWTLALQRVCEFVQADQAMMFWQGASASEVGVYHHYNNDPLYTRLFLDKLAPLNPVFPAVLFQEVGAVHTFSDLVPLREARETTFYKEWVVPQGLTDALAVLLERDAVQVAVLSLPCREGQIDAAARRRFALLVPHLQRAVAIGRLFAQHKRDALTLTEAIDRVEEAVFLLAEDRRVVFANAQAREVIDQGTVLHVRHERLRAVAAEADRALASGLRLIESSEPTSASGTSFALEELQHQRLTAHLLPLSETGREQIGRTPRPVAALHLRRAHFPDLTPLEALARRFQLTASEVRVVDATLRVSGLDAIAAALGISKATVKTHLNRVYRKCAIKNQSSLIKLVVGLSDR